MIGKLSAALADLLVRNRQIGSDAHALYAYGFYVLLSQCFFLSLTAAAGCLLHILPQSLLFYISFQALRRYSGGCHAKTENQCTVLSFLAIFAALLCIRFAGGAVFLPIWIGIAAVGSLVILLWSPLDTKERPLSAKERRVFRKISYLLLGAADILCVLSFLLEWKWLSRPLAAAICLESILLAAGKLQARKAGANNRPV